MRLRVRRAEVVDADGVVEPGVLGGGEGVEGEAQRVHPLEARHRGGLQSVRTALSTGTSPHTSSRIFRVEPPKNSPTVLLNATPDLATSRCARSLASRSPLAAYSTRERLYTCSHRGFYAARGHSREERAHPRRRSSRR
jgi:hypothetical protein